MDRHPNDLTTDEEIDDALETAKEFQGEPRVVAAEYLGRRADLIVLRLSTGGRLAIPREHLQGLEQASEGQLAVIKLWGGGISVSWPQLNVDHYLPHLLEHRYGDARWMEALQRRGPRLRSRFRFAGLCGGTRVKVWVRRRLMACGLVRIRMTTRRRMCMGLMQRPG